MLSEQSRKADTLCPPMSLRVLSVFQTSSSISIPQLWTPTQLRNWLPFLCPHQSSVTVGSWFAPQLHHFQIRNTLRCKFCTVSPVSLVIKLLLISPLCSGSLQWLPSLPCFASPRTLSVICTCLMNYLLVHIFLNVYL